MGRIKSIDEIKAELRAMTGKSKIFRRAKIADVEVRHKPFNQQRSRAMGRAVVASC